MNGDNAMHWVDRVCRRVTPNLGGVLTVCQDDDRLLDDAVVRDALVERGVAVTVWDGQSASVPKPTAVGPDDRPLLVVRGIMPLHAVHGLWPTSRSDITVHASDIWPRLDRDVILAVPLGQREALLAVALGVATPMNRRESALVVARALYGVDAARLSSGGWWPTLVLLWLQGTTIPPAIAEEVVQAASKYLPVTTSEAVGALTDEAGRPGLLAQAGKAGKLPLRAEANEPLLKLLKGAATPAPSVVPQVKLMERWQDIGESGAAAAEVMRAWAESAASGTLAASDDAQFQTAFEPWLRTNHARLLHQPVRELLPIHAVVPQLDLESGDRPLLLIVLDAMGLVPWHTVLAAWQRAGAHFDADTRVGIAAAPTITSVSRLSLLAGEMQPAGFAKSVKAKAECDAWAERFAERDFGGRCQAIAIKDRQILSDRLAQGVPRLALVDVSWDHMMHEADATEGSVAHHAQRWARGTAAMAIREMIEEALDADYRVFVTADHGCTAAIGNGRVRTGDLVEEGSKRVQLFKTADSATAYAGAGYLWQPETCPDGLTALFARPNESFDLKGVASFCHGGLSPAEVLVPVAELRKSSKVQ